MFGTGTGLVSNSRGDKGVLLQVAERLLDEAGERLVVFLS